MMGYGWYRHPPPSGGVRIGDLGEFDDERGRPRLGFVIHTDAGERGRGVLAIRDGIAGRVRLPSAVRVIGHQDGMTDEEGNSYE